MKKLLSIFLMAVISLGLITTTVQADATKGQKLIMKKLKKPCGFNGSVLAKKHSQTEWQAIFDEGKLSDELLTICPKLKDEKPLKEKYLKHIFDFLYNYANDSGNVPSC